MADKYFSGKSASERAHEAGLAALAETQRSEMGKLARAHDSLSARLSSQLEGQATQLMRLEAQLSRQTAEIEANRALLRRLAVWSKAAGILGGLIVLLLLVLVVLSVHHSR